MTDEINPDLIDVEWKTDDPNMPEGFFGLIQDQEEAPFGVDNWPADVPVMSIDECYDYLYDVIKPNYGTLTPADQNILPYTNQSPESSCVCCAQSAMFRGLRNVKLGWQYELCFSPMWMYQRICSRQHSGSYMVDAANHSLDHGNLPESSAYYEVGEHQSRLELAHERAKALCPHHYQQNRNYQGRNKYPEGEATAKYFKAVQLSSIPSINHACTALAMQRPLFNGRSGHSICQDALVFESDNRRKPLWRYCDSYGPGRGTDGRLYDSQRSWNISGAYVIWDLNIEQNPLFPCGSDTKPVSLEKYYDLFPAVDRDLIQQLYDQGPA